MVSKIILVAVIFGQSPSSSAKVKSRVERQAANSTKESRVLPLRVAIGIDKSSYQLSDSVTFNVLLINQSQASVYLFAELDWGESASLSLWVKNATTGKGVTGSFIADAPSPPPSSRDAFIKLQPHHLYGLTLTTTLKELGIQQHGRYTLVVKYHSPVPSAMNFGLPIWSYEDGAVSSDPVTITVSP
jgi:hypothetical protein